MDIFDEYDKYLSRRVSTEDLLIALMDSIDNNPNIGFLYLIKYIKDYCDGDYGLRDCKIFVETMMELGLVDKDTKIVHHSVKEIESYDDLLEIRGSDVVSFLRKKKINKIEK